MQRAARSAGWPVFVLLNGGGSARAAGWPGGRAGCSTMAR